MGAAAFACACFSPPRSSPICSGRVLVALGIEQVRIAPGITASTPLEFISYPYSHSLLTLILWGAVFGWRWHALHCADAIAPIARCVRRHARCWSSATGCSTSSRTFPTCRCIPADRSSAWDCGIHVPATLAVEIVMFAIGVWIYARATRARDAIGKWAFVGVTAFLFVGFVINANGTPPPSVTALWLMAIVLGGCTLWLRMVGRPSPPAAHGSIRLHRTTASAGPMEEHGYEGGTGRRDTARGNLGRLHRHFLRAVVPCSAGGRHGSFFIPLVVITTC